MCYLVKENGKEKRISVSENLTHILKKSPRSEFHLQQNKFQGENFDIFLETAGSFSGGGERVMVMAVPAGYTTAQRKTVR